MFDDIAEANREIYGLYQIAQTMGTTLAIADTMALVSSKLSHVVPFSACALFLYAEQTEQLLCRFATGTDCRADSAAHAAKRSGTDRMGGAQSASADQRAAQRRSRGHGLECTDGAAIGARVPAALATG